MSYSERSYSGDSRSYSQGGYTTSQPVGSYTTTSQREYTTTTNVTTQRETGYNTSAVTRSTEGRIVGDHGPPRGAGFLSISYTWDHVNLRHLHTWQTYSYQSSEGRDFWLRTFEEDQEWLRKLAEEGHRPAPAPVVVRDAKWDRPWIGAIVVTTDPSVVILKDCIRDGPADLAHLDDDDIIVGFGGATITDTSSFNRAFREYATPEKEVQVTYLESGRGSPKTTTLRVLSIGHKEEHLQSLRSRGLKETTDHRRQ